MSVCHWLALVSHTLKIKCQLHVKKKKEGTECETCHTLPPLSNIFSQSIKYSAVLEEHVV